MTAAHERELAVGLTVLGVVVTVAGMIWQHLFIPDGLRRRVQRRRRENAAMRQRVIEWLRQFDKGDDDA